MARPTTPEPARPDELEAAFALLFSDLAPAERDRRVANAVGLVRAGELDPQGVLVLRGPAGVAAVLVCLPVAGAGALVWPPRAVDDARRAEREDALVRHAEGWLRGRGVKLAQCLLLPEELPLAPPLQRNGFAHITHLWYLRHDLDLPPRLLGTPSRLDFRDYADAPALFRRTLLRSYEGTLDCPEVTGVRTIEEVIDGHRAQGAVRPGHWLLALDAGQPVGVLLAVDLREGGREVVYTGVVPEARRRGFGREMLLHALCDARAAAVPHVSLSVDGRNTPARALYCELGFEPVERREVFLAVWARAR